jgi:SAM-dependent methyltransferase
MFFENLLRALKFLAQGQFRRVWNEVHVRIYRAVYEVLWLLVSPLRSAGRTPPSGSLSVQTEHPVAFESPDHLAPKGTAENNSTNKKFVLHMDTKLHREFGAGALRVMDLGCSGGQMVRDFIDLRWLGLGLEGSDFSLKHRRANWAELANTHLFTCDITKPFRATLDSQPVRFHLITSWEVMEHIATPDLTQVFKNVCDHLEPGGYFIASTTETSDMHEGLELHQTRWPNSQWREFVAKNFPDLEYVDVGLKIYQFVRYNFLHPSFLLYRKKATP